MSLGIGPPRLNKAINRQTVRVLLIIRPNESTNPTQNPLPMKIVDGFIASKPLVAA
jgi:hypothetical protein